MSATRTIAKNTLFLSLTVAIGMVLAFLLVMKIGRALGSENLGIYTLATTFLQVFVLVPNFGLDTLAVRDVARRRENASEIFSNMVAAKGMLMAPAYVLLVATVFVLDYPPEVRAVILLYGLSLFFDPLAEASSAVYQGFERMEINTIVSGSAKVVVTGVALWLLERGWGVREVLLVQLSGSLVVLPFHLHFVRKLVADFSLRISWPTLASRVREAAPLFLTNLVGLLYFRADIVMLSKMRGEAEVGFYGAAYSILRALTFMPTIVVTAVYPVLSRYYASDPQSMRRLCATAFRYLGAVAIPIVFGLAALSRETIDLIYGAEFVRSGEALGVLIWTFIAFPMNTLLGYMLFTANRQKNFLVMKVVTLVVNIALNAVLIPRHGVIGAAAATVATSLVSLVFHHELVARYIFRPNLPGALWKPLVGAAIMWVVVDRVRGLPLGVAILAGAAVYAAALLALRFLTPDDREIFRRIFRRGETTTEA